MYIEKIVDHIKDFLPLLLLADDEEHINHYIEKAESYVLFNDDKQPIGICLVADKEENVVEIENFGILEDFQGKGYGKKLLKSICEKYSDKKIILGTDDVSGNVQFYEKSGFTVEKIIPNYFVEHYSEPIYENGLQLRDKVYLARTSK